ANGTTITAMDRIAHAEGTRAKHKLDTTVLSLTASLKKHVALDEVKNLQKAEATLRTATKALNDLEKAGTKSGAKHEKAKALVAEKQKSVAKVAADYEPIRADYQEKKDRLA